jgi:F1F0 ATPase subunit 2
MTSPTLPFLALQFCAGALAGGLLGYAYFRALWWNVSLIDKGSTAMALVFFVLRFAMLAAAFFGLAQFGALPLLAAAAGLLAARRLALRRMGSAP